MKIIAILFIFFASLQINSNKLEVSVENEKENILTLGVDNPLTALIESTSKRDVVLTTNNGIIEKAGGNRFIIRPAIVGVATINVCKLVKKDTVIIGKREFRVHRLPEPVTRIGSIASGPVKKQFLLAQGGVIARMECCGFDLPIQITEYTLIAIRDSSILGLSINKGARYSTKSIDLLTQLQPNDRLAVTGLVARFPDQTRFLHPMEFIIEE